MEALAVLRRRTASTICDYGKQPRRNIQRIHCTSQSQPRPLLLAVIRNPAPQRQARRRNVAFVPARRISVGSGSSTTVSRSQQAPARDNGHAPAGLDQDVEIQRAEELAHGILTSPTIPSEKESLEALKACETAAQILVSATESKKVSSTQADTTPASVLLSLESKTSPPTRRNPATTIDSISELAYKLVLHPPVFLTPAILETYTRIQTLLNRPQTLPHVFDLYATKPAPRPNTSSPIRYYSPPNPAKAVAVIPPAVANSALDTAIRLRQLPIALSIVSTSFAAPAFRRAKFLRKALPPILGFSLAPAAAYALASHLALQYDTLDPVSATGVAFAGIFTYVAATTTIGYVAITTANDQMDRVTWAIGMPLRERWLREDERGAVDRVAGAWGFKERWRRGDEEGEEWEALREWIGMRGMVLDKSELLEGME